jgi:hypothetical protein
VFTYGQTNPLQTLLMKRMMELGSPGQPLSAREVAERASGLVQQDVLREILRAERTPILSVDEVRGLALALGLSEESIVQAATVLPDV